MLACIKPVSLGDRWSEQMCKKAIEYVNSIESNVSLPGEQALVMSQIVIWNSVSQPIIILTYHMPWLLDIEDGLLEIQ